MAADEEDTLANAGSCLITLNPHLGSGEREQEWSTPVSHFLREGSVS